MGIAKRIHCAFFLYVTFLQSSFSALQPLSYRDPHSVPLTTATVTTFSFLLYYIWEALHTITFPLTLAWFLTEKEEAMGEITQAVSFKTLSNSPNKAYEVSAEEKDEGQRQHAPEWFRKSWQASNGHGLYGFDI